MALQSVWYFTDIPQDLIDIVEKDCLDNFDPHLHDSMLSGDIVNKEKRNSKNAWISTNHWIGGFIWHYVQKANRENFLYDLTNIDGESIQYTSYSEGQFYNWHNDMGLSQCYRPMSTGSNRSNHDEQITDYLARNIESIRKLSFVLQLSSPDDYEGGNLQLISDNGESYFAPRQKGTMIFFDSRTQHRVLKVTKGVRKSLVGWVCGPRWK